MSPDESVDTGVSGRSVRSDAARSLRFVAERTVDVTTHPVPQPGPNEVLIEAVVSAISAGTERLIYRNESPDGIEADEFLPTLDGELSYPLSYGYATVGTVVAVGENVDSTWLDRRVFAYHPHASHFTISVEHAMKIPESLTFEEATLFANMETAVTFLLDGQPVVGERVLVFGQGVVGLLTTSILGEMPLDSLITVDAFEKRCAVSEEFGADRAIHLERADVAVVLESTWDRGADLVYEVSGNPEALDDAIALTGFGGRVIVGSWYGEKPSTVHLGGNFHRDRIEIRSSQVSTLPPSVDGRITRDRRREIAWDWLEHLPVSKLLTHRIPIEEAPRAFELLDTRPADTIQLLLTYP